MNEISCSVFFLVSYLKKILRTLEGITMLKRNVPYIKYTKIIIKIWLRNFENANKIIEIPGVVKEIVSSAVSKVSYVSEHLELIFL